MNLGKAGKAEIEYVFAKIQEEAKEQVKKTSKPCKVTHVFMQEKHLRFIPKIKSCHTVTHAYFHNNEICRIDGLIGCVDLTFLNLQNNQIAKIENINHLFFLKKLFLGNNKISIIENLHGLRNLEELYLEKQHLGKNAEIIFDPRSTMDIGVTLKILDVSSTGLTTLEWVKPLRELHTFIARNNNLENFEDAADNLCVLYRLNKVYFAGNPMVKKHRFFETLIARCIHLKFIDDKSISEQSRHFLSNFEKALKQRKISNVTSSEEIDQVNEHFSELGFEYGPQSYSALSLQIPDKYFDPKKKLATNASYNMVPKCFIRNKYLKRCMRKVNETEKPASFLTKNSLEFGERVEGGQFSFLHKDTLYLTKNTLAQPLSNSEPRLTSMKSVQSVYGMAEKKRGILKKPMPMKYVM